MAKKPCNMCLNARVDKELTDNNDLSYHTIGKSLKTFRIMISSGNRKPTTIIFEHWNGKQWELVGYYEPPYCPNCGRKIKEYRHGTE